MQWWFTMCGKPPRPHSPRATWNRAMSPRLPGAECVGIIIDEKFSLLEWLGGTPHSSVFRTQLHMDPPRDAILKLIPESAVNAEALTAQWETARTLTHPNLVQLFHSGKCELNGKHFHFAVTEYAEELLSETVPARTLTPIEVSEMLVPILDALTYLHIRHLAHASLKPSNIMVVGDTLKLSVDSVHREEDPSSIQRNTSSGANTLEASVYHAPELANNPPTRAADMWSLGVLLVEALTQKLIKLHASRATNPTVPSTLPEPYLGIASACLNIDPAARCTLGDIHTILHPAPAAPAVVQSSAPPLSPSQAGRRYRFYVIVGVILAALGGGIAALVSMHSRHSAREQQAAATSQETAAVAPESASSQPESTQPASAQTSAAPPASSATQPIKPVTPTPQPVSPPAKAAPPADGRVHQVMPDIPKRSLDTITGHVHIAVRVEVNGAGNVANATLAERGPSAYFARLVLDASRKWTFPPAPGAWIIHYTLTQTGVDAAAEPAQP